MKRTDFSFELPDSLIANYPLPQRTQSRLLYMDGNSGSLEHGYFADIFTYIRPGDLLILNNTKVLPARLFGRKSSGGNLEFLVERIVDKHHAWVHCKASKRPAVNSDIIVEEKIRASIIDDKNALLLIRFNDVRTVMQLLHLYGRMPLPPYMRREAEELDRDRYQTVFAKYDGSVAAPTAGLHFDENLLASLSEAGVHLAEVTLHVGAGTFQPMRVEDLDEHVMHPEYAELSAETCDAIIQTKQRGNRVIAVGTTSVRTIETAALAGEIKPFTGETNLFISPGFEFQCVDAMVTNFHLPESTLLMLVCAFAGYDHVMSAYQEAINKLYRFFSYGDAMFITRQQL